LESDIQRERLGSLTSERKVLVALSLVDASLHICAEGIRAQDPNISEEKLIEELKARLVWSRRMQRQ
jgi:hypothetical protein